MDVDPQIFRSYDIRGIVEEQLTTHTVEAIGCAFGSELKSRGKSPTCVIGRDGRLSSPQFADALSQGLKSAGINVIDVGLVPTPLLYYAGYEFDASGSVMVTGSHNPVNYNGLKFSLNQLPFAGSELTGLKQRVVQDKFDLSEGSYSQQEILDSYVIAYQDQFSLNTNLKLVVDCGNGASGVLTRPLLDTLGVQYDILFEEVDGTFPNHHPDPSVIENLSDLIETVKTRGADLGIGFDGDGDRLGVVTEKGQFVPADQLVALFASDILAKNAGGSVIFDVKCGYCVRDQIKQSGGVGILSPTGHTNLKSLLREHKAVLAGELSGHICFADRWYPIDDAAYAAGRLLELLSKTTKPLSELIENYNQWTNTEELFIQVDEQRKFELIEALKISQHFESENKVLLDGVRVEFKDGWGLMRASNTNPVLSIRFEARDLDALGAVRDRFAAALHEIAPDLSIPAIQ